MQSVLRAAVRSGQANVVLHRRAAASRVTLPRLGIRTLTKFYTKEHETISYDDKTGVGIITITEHAQASLGDVVFVELPPVGEAVEKGGNIGAVESVKAVSDIYAPVSGVVEEINETLKDQPSLLNKSPEEEGWLCKIKLSNPSELKELLTKESYLSHVEGEDAV